MNVEQSIARAFETTKDSRISYNVAEMGSASLITGVFPTNGTRAPNFYSSPDIANDETTKLAIIYGEVMISPYMVDAGVQTSTNDPANILKTYRFIFGDGESGGVVTGPNGTQTENVYIIDKNKQPVPIVSKDGTVSMGDVVLASILGSAITSAPKLWDAVFTSAKNDPNKSVPTVDPITGQKVLTPAEKITNQVVPALDELRNVDSTGKGDGYVLVWDPSDGRWVAKPIQSILEDMGSTEVCGGAGGEGGSGGQGGAGGSGGQGGDGGGEPPEPPPDPKGPTTSPETEPCSPAPQKVGNNGMILLPTEQNTPDNEYSQLVSIVGTLGLELHFFAGGAGKKVVWDSANPTISDPDNAYPCLEDPKGDTMPVAPATSYMVASDFKIKICITVPICGEDVLIFREEISEIALSAVSYSWIGKTIKWQDTKLGPLLTQYPGQIVNLQFPTAKLYLQRVDQCGNEYPVYFEGYTRLIANETNRRIGGKPADKTQSNASTSPSPEPVVKKADDGKFPSVRPFGGVTGTPICPPEPPPAPPGQGQPGSPGTGGGGGTPGTPPGEPTCGEITPGPPKPQPKIAFLTPCARVYGTQTTPPAFDPVRLPSVVLGSGTTDQTVTLVYSIDIGEGTFSLTGATPGTVVATPGNLTFTLVGPAADVQTAAGLLQITPANVSIGEIHYKAVLTNADMQNAGTACQLMPQDIVITENQAACTKLVFDPATTGGTVAITVTYNGATNYLTSAPVPFITDINQLAIDLALNIAANVTAKNSLQAGSEGWLPKYTTTATSGTLGICSPETSGCSWNRSTIAYETTGAIVVNDLQSIKTFLGGACKTVSDFVTNGMPNWDKALDVLLGMAGNVAGAVITNTIMNNASQVQITMPEIPVDASVAFLYRGNKVRVPGGYDGTLRTGMPTYDAWVAAGKVWEVEWTNNPIWCLYDYITNQVYGLGKDIPMNATQETALLKDLFDLGAYVDELVQDENDQPQVRFSLNTAITDGTRLQILEQICSNFRGAYSWHFGGLRITADRQIPTISLLVNQGNAGKFVYNMTSSGNFTNMINLTYVEPSNFYKNEVVQAKNNDAYITWGKKAKDLTYFGCTNRSQAIRQSNWHLLTEKYNSALVTYTAGEDHFNLVPGQVVQFADSGEDGNRRGGRIVSITGVNVVIDGSITAVAGDSISITCQDGTIFQTTIVSITGTAVVLTAAPVVPVIESATFITAPAIGKQLFRVVKIDETNTSQYNVTLQVYRVEKFNIETARNVLINTAYEVI